MRLLKCTRTHTKKEDEVDGNTILEQKKIKPRIYDYFSSWCFFFLLLFLCCLDDLNQNVKFLETFGWWCKDNIYTVSVTVIRVYGACFFISAFDRLRSKSQDEQSKKWRKENGEARLRLPKNRTIFHSINLKSCYLWVIYFYSPMLNGLVLHWGHTQKKKQIRWAIGRNLHPHSATVRCAIDLQTTEYICISFSESRF